MGMYLAVDFCSILCLMYGESVSVARLIARKKVPYKAGTEIGREHKIKSGQECLE